MNFPVAQLTYVVNRYKLCVIADLTLTVRPSVSKQCCVSRFATVPSALGVYSYVRVTLVDTVRMSVDQEVSSANRPASAALAFDDTPESARPPPALSHPHSAEDEVFLDGARAYSSAKSVDKNFGTPLGLRSIRSAIPRVSAMGTMGMCLRCRQSACLGGD